MLRPLPAVHPGVKRLFYALTLLAALPALAIDVDPALDRAVREALLICADGKLEYQDLNIKVPAHFKGALVRVESKRPSCQGQYAAIVSPTGGFYLGMPWPVAEAEGSTAEEKLKNFVWQNLQMNVTPVIDRQKTTDDGLYRVTLNQATENGKMPLQGDIDLNTQTFFYGRFRRLAGNIHSQRVKGFEPFFANLPSKGPAGAPVTIVEFSDFECPSCRRSEGYADALIAKFGDQIRYVRFDLPLAMHPWAFGAALAGRAIHRQNPETFWKFKKEVYSNQDKLTSFSFWDFARAFAEDHDIDLKRYDADLQSEEIKNEILRGAGTALSNDIRFTPAYLVNGALVDAGDEAKGLTEYIEKLLAKK